ncbi:ABC transporter permease [soil metagenome]
MTHVIADSATMLHRNLIHMIRYPGLTLFLVAAPVVFLLLFVFVFGGTLGAGLPGVSGGTATDYLNYLVPGLLLLTVGGGVAGTAAISVAMDMTEGIVARFRTMAISRTAVLTGHVLGTVVQGLLAVALLVGVALLLGFRPTAGPLGWIGAIAILVVVSLAVAQLAVAMGIASRTVETASNLPMLILLLPMLGSGFVPTGSMPAWLQGFAQYQPFTPFIETVRGLLFGTDLGIYPWLTLGWAVAIGAGGYLWARMLYERRSVIR